MLAFTNVQCVHKNSSDLRTTFAKGKRVGKMFKTYLIMLFFFEKDTIRQDSFLDMLKKLRIGNNMIFLFTGALGTGVCDFLNAEFTNRWIGSDGPTPWSPPSPDITTLFLWVFVENKDQDINISF